MFTLKMLCFGIFWGICWIFGNDRDGTSRDGPKHPQHFTKYGDEQSDEYE